MTIFEFLESLKKQPLVAAPEEWRPDYIRIATQAMEVWTNNACLGYALAAAGEAGFTTEQKKQLVEGMKAAFEDMTLDEAESYYTNSGH